MKLWRQTCRPDETIERFLAGSDPVLDHRLVRHDCRASAAHAAMLRSIGVLSAEELQALERALVEIEKLEARGELEIGAGDEDCHTAIERYLTAACGDAGRKIHTGRSRNDQVLTALRLYEREALSGIEARVTAYRDALQRVVDVQGEIPLPGYTHMQRAMPTTAGVWAGSFAEAAADDLRMLAAVRELVDQSPLGTAAGFGVPGLAIDREATARRLEFSRLIANPLHAQLSRGRTEGAVLGVCTLILLGLNRLATDLILFATREFGFVKLAPEHVTGSSLMPQKRNPDVLELVRARYHEVLAHELAVKSIAANLMSGYNRDIQLTKEPLMKGLDVTADCLEVTTLVLDGLAFDRARCAAALTPEMFATERVHELVSQGVPFREAYGRVARELDPEGGEPGGGGEP